MSWNKVWYDFHGSFREHFDLKFKKHYCIKCGSKLLKDKLKKTIHSDDSEAQFYSFPDGHIKGYYDFIHKAFFCPKCYEVIEFNTQLSLEKIEYIIKESEKLLKKSKKNIIVKKYYETKNNKTVSKLIALESIENICLAFVKDNTEIAVYKAKLLRQNINHRPYYFDITKKSVLNFIKNEVLANI